MNWIPDPSDIDKLSFIWGMGYGIVSLLGIAWYIWLVWSVLNK